MLQNSITSQLSTRQIDILRKVARGKTYKEIATSMNLSETTIKNQMKQILFNLQFESRTQAILYLQEYDFGKRAH